MPCHVTIFIFKVPSYCVSLLIKSNGKVQCKAQMPLFIFKIGREAQLQVGTIVWKAITRLQGGNPNAPGAKFSPHPEVKAFQNCTQSFASDNIKSVSPFSLFTMRAQKVRLQNQLLYVRNTDSTFTVACDHILLYHLS